MDVPAGEKPTDLRSFSQSVVERVRTNSALNPLLWLCGVTLFFTTPGAIWGPSPISYIFLALACATVAAPILAYFIWMFRDPDKIQSEHYQLERRKIDLLGDERHRGPPLIDGELVDNKRLKDLAGKASS